MKTLIQTPLEMFDQTLDKCETCTDEEFLEIKRKVLKSLYLAEEAGAAVEGSYGNFKDAFDSVESFRKLQDD